MIDMNEQHKMMTGSAFKKENVRFLKRPPGSTQQIFPVLSYILYPETSAHVPVHLFSFILITALTSQWILPYFWEGDSLSQLPGRTPSAEKRRNEGS